jgi:5-methylthioadenosine/S-adenosylhomocysteine deaminase
MESIDTLIKARWIVPVEPDGMIHNRAALAIAGGYIKAILPAQEAETRYQAAEVIELDRHVLIPGLVNAHTHAAMSLLRGLADDLPLARWLEEHIWPTESRWVGAEFVRDGTELAIAEMLAGGVTCFQDMYFFPNVAAEVVAAQGIRACLGIIMFDFPSAWGTGPRDYLAKGLAVRDEYKHHPLLSFAFAPHAPYTVGDECLREVKTLADELDVPVHMHVHETAGEIEDSLKAHGRRPLTRLAALGLLMPGLMAVHMTQLESAEIAELARLGVNVIHCPESNLKLASGFCPLAELTAASVNVALGTDSAASNNDLDMFSEMRTAALLAKGLSGDAAAVPAALALRMATLNGAQALGLREHIGSLVPGKWADVVAVDLGGLASQPVYNPLSQLVYATHRSQVSDVWVAGERLVQAGRLRRLDSADIGARIERWQARIAAP